MDRVGGGRSWAQNARGASGWGQEDAVGRVGVALGSVAVGLVCGIGGAGEGRGGNADGRVGERGGGARGGASHPASPRVRAGPREQGAKPRLTRCPAPWAQQSHRVQDLRGPATPGQRRRTRPGMDLMSRAERA